METDIEAIKAAVKLCHTEEEAFKMVQNTKGVSQEAAAWFQEEYSPKRELTPKQAFSLFYRELKTGKI